MKITRYCGLEYLKIDLRLSEPITACLTGPRALQTRATFLSIFDKRQSYLQFIHNVYFFIIPLPAPNMLDL